MHTDSMLRAPVYSAIQGPPIVIPSPTCMWDPSTIHLKHIFERKNRAKLPIFEENPPSSIPPPHTPHTT